MDDKDIEVRVNETYKRHKNIHQIQALLAVICALEENGISVEKYLGPSVKALRRGGMEI